MNTQTIVAPKEVGVWAPVRRVKVSKYARKHSERDVQSRAASMAREGQLQNAILVRAEDPNFPDGWCYELVLGNGRYESAKLNGWESLKADIYEGLTEPQKLQMALAEDGEREEPSPFHTGFLYSRMLELEGIDQLQLAERLGKDPGDLSRLLVLAALAPEIQEKLERSNFSMGQIREIMRLVKPEQQLKMADLCAKGDWSVRELRQRVDKELAGPSEKAEKPQEQKGPFQFTWKKGVATLKARAFEPQYETIEDYAQDLVAAYQAFAQAHPVPQEVEAPEATA